MQLVQSMIQKDILDEQIAKEVFELVAEQIQSEE
jgi:hypothetical protein